MSKLITVFTPTYNRCEKLHELYESLCAQSVMNFKWLIIDDGSIDATRWAVNKWINEEIIDIYYEYQENQGKHVAFNRGVELCDTELFFCVDSDDRITRDAISVFINRWEKIQQKEHLSGMVAYRGYNEKTIIGTEFPHGVIEETLSGLYKKGKQGDTALVYRTDILKRFPFPVYQGEKFMRESVIYHKIDETLKMLVIPQILYIGEYLNDGLSKNACKYEEASPNGAALYRLEQYRCSNSAKEKFAYGIAYSYFMHKAGRKREIREGLEGLYSVVCPLFIWIEKIRRKVRER